MGKVRRVVNVDFWKDETVDEQFTPEDKLFMLYLLTGPDSSQLGIYKIFPKDAARHLGYSLETFWYLMDRFENVYGMIRYSKETREVAIKNYLRHSILKGGKPVEDLLKKEIKSIVNKDLVTWAFNHILKDIRSEYDYEINDTVKKVVYSYLGVEDNAPDIVPTKDDSTIPKKEENDKNNKNNCENENTNTNTNSESSTNRPRIVHESYHDSYHDSSSDSHTLTHKKYGRFQNVLLSDSDIDVLKLELPNKWERFVNELSDYLAGDSRRSYDNHLAVILSWARREKKEADKKKPYNPAMDYAQREYTEADNASWYIDFDAKYGDPFVT